MGKQSIGAVSAVLWVFAVGAPAPARAAEPPSIVSCAKRVTNGAREAVRKYAAWLADCEVDNLGSEADEKIDCRGEAAESNSVQGFLDNFFREVDDCANDAFRAICPFEAHNAEELIPKLQTPPSIVEAMLNLSEDIYFTPFGGGCIRPVDEAVQEAEECGKQIGRVSEDYADELMKCLFKCQLGRMRESSTSTFCVDPVTGAIGREKVSECFANEASDFREEILGKCEDEDEDDENFVDPPGDTDEMILDLGCPMGFPSIDEALNAIDARLQAIVFAVDEAIFRSPCKTDLEEAGGAVAIPATVTLEPSFTTKQVVCGQDLNSSFFGSDTIVRFDSNLDCTPIRTGTDGIVISKSDVTVSGRGEHRITGPQSKRNRIGTGIRVATAVSNVQIQGFPAIERFAVGIGDAGNNAGLRVLNTTVRRNEQTGIRLTSAGALVERVKADRNPVGFDLSGDNIEVTLSRALRSETPPGIGMRFGGVDGDGSGRIVRVAQSEIEGNLVGIQLNGGPHRVEDNSIRQNLGVGLHVASTRSLLDSNSIKGNLTDGIWVTGADNEITANSSDENAEDGYVVEGTNNNVNSNSSGSLTDNGNGGVGYRIGGTGNRFRTNRAEANVGGGFLVEAETAQFQSNTSNSNHAEGFKFTQGGSALDTNQASGNAGAEFIIAPNNSDPRPNSNRRNSVSFSFTTSGGTFD